MRAAYAALLMALLACTPLHTVRTPGLTSLRLEHQRQGPNLCLPTCASMILEYYGERHDPRTLKAMATPAGSTFPGTYVDDLRAALARLGYQWESRCFTQDAAGYAEGLPRLKREVFEGYPVMVGLHDPPIGHVVVLVGYDEGTHELTFVDPNQDAPGLVTMDEDDFRLYWREDILAGHRCATFTRPKKV
jgi:hypothetical protein